MFLLICYLSVCVCACESGRARERENEHISGILWWRSSCNSRMKVNWSVLWRCQRPDDAALKSPLRRAWAGFGNYSLQEIAQNSERHNNGFHRTCSARSGRAREKVSPDKNNAQYKHHNDGKRTGLVTSRLSLSFSHTLPRSSLSPRINTESQHLVIKYLFSSAPAK